MAKKATQLKQIGEGFDDVIGVLTSGNNKPKVLEILYGSPDKPLLIGSSEIACYVLEDGKRVITGYGMQTALGFQRETSGGNDLIKFMSGKKLNDFSNNLFREIIESRVAIKNPSNSPMIPIIYGFDATSLVEIANVLIEADIANILTVKQKIFADHARMLLNATAKIGIIGLIDEATGYQEIRAKDALQGLLDKFVTNELGKWMKRFPNEFYKQIFRLRNWEYSEKVISGKKPGVIGSWTKDIVYSRMAPGLLEELERVNPKISTKRRRGKHHQFLTEDIGHPELKSQIDMVIAIMRTSDNWDEFYERLDKALPKKIDAKQYLMNFEWD